MSVRIEAATLDDIPQLCELLAVLFTQEAEFRPDAARQAAGLRQIVERPEAGQILLLREGAGVMAMVNLLYTISTARGGRVAILEDMVVRPGRRAVRASRCLPTSPTRRRSVFTGATASKLPGCCRCAWFFLNSFQYATPDVACDIGGKPC